MSQDFELRDINTQLQLLKDELIKVLDSPFLSFVELMKINEIGLYVIISDDDILYVGKTTRAGKKRIRELTTDFRSHTFNKKMLVKHLDSLGYTVNKSNIKSTTESKGDVILDVKFKEAQQFVNTEIKKLKFKFYTTEKIQLTNFEHFAIGVLQPLFND
ncbi:hypothetical protein NAF17_01760 [Mucilaginibacter sp. RB4R14]|uniref:hypothetical protein n=1 Tax=Mucilaginibacter aurantiaciroseus TaxID=2949308 RepID=UPI00209140BE|nr:hypothetical protein [Mucilaginibacter aurantiaciroseus]MCO5934251.1 hypothetical protein [Mucilaginibacter aurantiaciroseus]